MYKLFLDYFDIIVVVITDSLYFNAREAIYKTAKKLWNLEGF